MRQQNLIKVQVLYKSTSFSSLSQESQKHISEVYNKFQQLLWHKITCVYQIFNTESHLLPLL